MPPRSSATVEPRQTRGTRSRRLAQGGDTSPLAVLESDRPKRKPRATSAPAVTPTVAPASTTPDLAAAVPSQAASSPVISPAAGTAASLAIGSFASPVTETAASTATETAASTATGFAASAATGIPASAATGIVVSPVTGIVVSPAAEIAVSPAAEIAASVVTETAAPPIAAAEDSSPRNAPEEAQTLTQVTAEVDVNPQAHHRESSTFSLPDFLHKQPDGSIKITFYEDQSFLDIRCEAVSAAAAAELREYFAPFSACRFKDPPLTPVCNVGKRKLDDLSKNPRLSQRPRLEEAVTPTRQRSSSMQRSSWQRNLRRRRLRLGLADQIRQDAETSPTRSNRSPDADNSLLSDPEDLPMVKEMYTYGAETEEERNSFKSRARQAALNLYYRAELSLNKTPPPEETSEAVIENVQSTETLPSAELPQPESTSLPVPPLSPVAESSTDLANNPATAPSPESPLAGRWDIGKFFSSARRFLPGGRREASTSPTQPLQSDPRANVSIDDQGNVSSVSDFSQRLRSSQSSKRKAFRTRETIAEVRRFRDDRVKLDEDRKQFEKDKEILAQQQKDIDAVHRALYARKVGEKRPRLPSPEVIPNPPGVSYGLDDNYFCYSSSESDENSPLHGRPNKRSRIESPDSSPSSPLIPAPSTTANAGAFATTYTGIFFADPPVNTFQNDPEKAKHAEKAKRDRELAELLDAQEAEDRERVAKFKEWERNRRMRFTRDKPQALHQPIVEQDIEEEHPQGQVVAQSAIQAPQQPAPLTDPSKDLAKPSEEASTATPVGISDAANQTPFPTAQNQPAPPFSAGGPPDEILKSKRAILREDIAARRLPNQVRSPPHSSGSRTNVQQRTIDSAITETTTESQVGASISNQQGNEGDLNILGAATRAQQQQQQRSINCTLPETTAESQVRASTSSQEGNGGGLNILGAATRVQQPQKANEEAPPKNAREVSPTSANFNAYSEYANSEMDMKVAALIENTWTSEDSEIAINDFERDYASSLAKQQNKGGDAESQAKAKGSQDADSEEVESELETELTDSDLDEPLIPVYCPEADYNLDPVVFEYLGSSWTVEDDKHADLNFEEELRAYTQSNQ